MASFRFDRLILREEMRGVTIEDFATRAERRDDRPKDAEHPDRAGAAIRGLVADARGTSRRASSGRSG